MLTVNSCVRSRISMKIGAGAYLVLTVALFPKATGKLIA
jgi:hypothetical protein